MSQPIPLIDPSRHPLVAGRAPAWADAWGQDRHGVFAAFTLGAVTQRLRWIPPGRFPMGSPPDETRGLARDDTERPWFEWEHPRHEVYLTQGYWLFDTPCTQALWAAVMDDNPSRFKSREPGRPAAERANLARPGPRSGSGRAAPGSCAQRGRLPAPTLLRGSKCGRSASSAKIGRGAPARHCHAGAWERESRNGYWERRTPVRRGLCSTRIAGVIREIAPHWGAALPGWAGLVPEIPLRGTRRRPV